MKYNSKDFPVLVIDASGSIGEGIVEYVSRKTPCVFATKSDEYSDLESDLVTVVGLKKKIPKIPGFTFQKIFYLASNEKQDEVFVSHIIDKAKENKASVVFLIPRDKANDTFVSSLIGLYSNISVLIFADILTGKDEFENRAEEILSMAVAEKRVELLGSGLSMVWPELLKTIVEKAISVSNLSGSGVYFCFPKNGLTELSFARRLHAINPDIKIQFVKKEKTKTKEDTVILPKKGEWVSDDDAFFSEVQNNKMLDEQGLRKKKVSQKEKNQEKFGKKIKLLLFFLISLLLLPFVVSLLSFFIGGFMLVSSIESFEKLNFDKSYKSASSSYSAFSFSENIVSDKNLKFLFSSFPVLQTIQYSKNGAEMLMDISGSFSKLEKVVKGKSKEPRDDFSSAIAGIKKTILLSNNAPFVNLLSFLPQQNEGKIMDALEKGNSAISSYSPLLDVAPFLFGFEGEKKYLVLFQNNMELRPSGGFIGSYGILTLTNGKIKDFSIHDVYDADGQLKGHVEPPYPIRKYLPSVHWYLRDSNFSPDFTVSASSAAYFLKEETGDEADGVIGVDVSVLRNILSATGPVYLSDYRMSVNKDTVYQVVQSQVHEGFFPGSNQKKNVLKSLFTAIIEKVENKEISLFALVKSILLSINEKHISIVVPNATIGNAFVVNKMASSFWDSRQKEKNGLYDFLSVSEANLGVNKSNYYIQRKMSYDVDFKDDTAGVSTLTFDLSHAGKKDESGNDYKAYVRVYVPEGSSFLDMQTNGQMENIVPAVVDAKLYEAKNFRTPQGLELNIEKDLGKTVFGFLVIVPTGTEKKITIRYKLPFRILSKEDSALYSLFIVKQPGTDPYPFSFSSSFPSIFNAKIVDGKSVSNSSVVSESKELENDRVINVEIQKKKQD